MIGGDLTTLNNAVRSHANKATVEQYTHNRLQDHLKPVLVPCANYHGYRVEKGTTEEASNLKQFVAVYVDSPIMLAEQGSFNSARGTVRDIIQPKRANWQTGFPFALVVDYHKYGGSEYVVHPESGHKLVPIFRSTHDWTRGVIQCERTQFRVEVAYASTIHESYGETLDQVLFNLTGNDNFFSSHLTRPATSRPTI